MNDDNFFDDEDHTPEEAQLSPASVFPWPPRESDSPLQAFVDTWKEATFQPSRFFAAMPKEERSGPSLLFVLIVTVIAAAVHLFWSLILPSVNDLAAPTSAYNAMRNVSPLIAFLITPIAVIVGLYFKAAVTQLMLLMLAPNRGPFGRTVRALAYSRTPLLFMIVPYAGVVIAVFWSLVTSIIAIREAHEISTGRAVAVVLLPAVLFMIVLTVIIFVFVAAALAVGK